MKLITSIGLIWLGLAVTTGLAFADDPHNQGNGDSNTIISNTVGNSSKQYVK